ncbi:MAG: putative peptidoglycan glycosyltransferase FtsW [Acidobacteriota bacterium]
MTKLRTDQILFLTVLAMVTFGIVMLYSASSAVADLRYHYPSYYFVLRQFGWALGSLVVMMFFKRFDYRRLNTPAWAFSGLGIVLAMLILVFIVDSRNHRWFRFPGVGSLQPSEFAKPALILFLAYFIARRTQVINRRRTLAQAFLAIAVLGLLVVASDLGNAVVPVITALVVLWVAGLEKKILAGLVGVGMLLGMGAVASRGYRLDRVISFVDPNYKLVDKLNPGGHIRRYTDHVDGGRDGAYQPRQSIIAVGAGGPWGVGLMEGKQKLMFLPEAHTDYIYATIGEELGLWGSTAVLAGFLIVLWRGARLFVLAREDFGKYLALGVTVTIVVQALINISVVLDLGPTKGFPLPMISFGGSSLLSTLISMGMLLSVGEHEG